MSEAQNQWIQRIEDDPTFDVLITSARFAALVHSESFQDSEQAKAALGAILWEGDDPVDYETQGSDLSIIASLNQLPDVCQCLVDLGIGPIWVNAKVATCSSIQRILDRRLHLMWRKSADLEDSAPHAMDIFEDNDGLLTAVLTIKKPKGNQTMRVKLPQETTLVYIQNSWKGNWSSNEEPKKAGVENGIFFHVRNFALPNGQYLIWKVKHKYDAPDDESYVSENVPTMQEAFADDPDFLANAV